ncbi:hypothetical protein AbraIFM66950_008448 [Aspergillus brasiliensis]|nr:hypothetical protein AbraIFM66950_008448 [Aspergillus brasiliensis]
MPDIVTAQSSLKERLPNLLLGNNRTTSSALHQVEFIGRLTEWENFEEDVIRDYRMQDWGPNKVLDYKPHGFVTISSLRNEHVAVGDEMGVQGRWQQHICQVMSSIFHAQGLDLTLGDFRTSSSVYGKRPDIACMAYVTHVQSWKGDPQPPDLLPVLRDLVFVGELKTPWVKQHSLSSGVKDEGLFCRMIGQIAEYMKDLDLRYGLMSTYNETIFLRQVQNTATRLWELQYSPVIHHSTSADLVSGTPSLRQCIWHVARALDSPLEIGKAKELITSDNAVTESCEPRANYTPAASHLEKISGSIIIRTRAYVLM